MCCLTESRLFSDSHQSWYLHHKSCQTICTLGSYFKLIPWLDFQGPLVSWLSFLETLIFSLKSVLYLFYSLCGGHKNTTATHKVITIHYDVDCVFYYQQALCWICGTVCFSSPLHETRHLHWSCCRQRCITCLPRVFAKAFLLALIHIHMHINVCMQKHTGRQKTCSLCHSGGMQSVTWPHHQPGG